MLLTPILIITSLMAVLGALLTQQHHRKQLQILRPVLARNPMKEN